MVEVFKTNVQRKGEAKILLLKLTEQFSDYKINFDLEDCDKILRVEDDKVLPEGVAHLLNSFG